MEFKKEKTAGPYTHSRHYVDGLNVMTAQGYAQKSIRQMFQKRASWAQFSLPDVKKCHISPSKRGFGTEIPNH